jgi:hypothetical protein
MLRHLEVTTIEPVLGGKTFGTVGAYEVVIGKAHFAFDPNRECNVPIVDLKLAPRDSDGLVACWADFHLLKPLRPERGNGAIFYNVVNRGRHTVLSTFNLAEGDNRPHAAAHFGDGFLMREGFAVAACGWQADVPSEAENEKHLLTLCAPQVHVKGVVSCEIVVDTPTALHSLGSRYHTPYDPKNRQESGAKLTVRDYPYDPPKEIPRDRWTFSHLADGRPAIRFDAGFLPGLIYNLVYTAKNPQVMGLGFAATRDFLSFLKFGAKGNPLRGAVDRVHAFGSSQSGRFLRHMLRQGFNRDESGRKVMDGVMANVSGGGQGSFNHRFAQPSRHASAHGDVYYPTEQFPFTDAPQTDVVTGQTAGLLDACEAAGLTPKIFYTNTSTEYWNRGASLSHTDTTGERDAIVHPAVRIYHFAGTQHGPGDVPTGPLAEWPPNTVNFRYGLRALLVALDNWVSLDAAPPDSSYGNRADKTLVPLDEVRWPTLPGVPRPARIRQPLRLNWGERWGEGIIDLEPPEPGEPYAVRLPQVDEDGNEIPGIRMPEVAVPLGTFTGWRYRTEDLGGSDALVGLQGMWVPFPLCEADRKGDARRPLDARYQGKEDYLGRIALAAIGLVESGFMMREDVSHAVTRAGQMYDWMVNRENNRRV